MTRVSIVPSQRRAGVGAGLRLSAEAGRFLALDDERGLRDYLRKRWGVAELTEQLGHPESAVVRIAAACLGLVGSIEQSAALSRALHHDDYFVVVVAESALRGIWFRSSKSRCCRTLRLAVELMNRYDYDRALALLHRILSEDPGFAEAYNQRAIVHYLCGRFERSIGDCRRALALNPYHFGALGGMGHCHTRLGQYETAAAAYHRTLELHPRLEAIRQALRQARELALISGPAEGSVCGCQPLEAACRAVESPDCAWRVFRA